MDFLLGLLTSPWALLVVFACTIVDGFFPPIPSETLVIALAAGDLASTPGSPAIALLAVATWLAAFLGDNIAYLVGRRAAFQRWRIFSGPRSQRSAEAVRRALERRGVLTLLVVRYVPVGRVFVNMTAGSLGYPRHRFVVVTIVSSALWTAQCLLYAAVGQAWFGGNPLVGMIGGVALALLVGAALDRIVRAVRSRRMHREASTARAQSTEDGRSSRAMIRATTSAGSPAIETANPSSSGPRGSRVAN